MVTVWWSAAHLIHCSFLNPDETSTAEACPANWWDALKTATPVAGTGQQKRPNSSPRQHPIILCTTNTSKVERTGLQFCLIHHTHLTSQQPATSFLSISQEAENVLIVMVPLLINKDVVEPSYNHLKFTVQNPNYICTNLVDGTFCGQSPRW